MTSYIFHTNETASDPIETIPLGRCRASSDFDAIALMNRIMTMNNGTVHQPLGHVHVQTQMRKKKKKTQGSFEAFL